MPSLRISLVTASEGPSIKKFILQKAFVLQALLVLCNVYLIP